MTTVVDAIAGYLGERRDILWLRLGPDALVVSRIDPSGEAALYLRALVDSRVFFKKEIDVTSMVEILKSAIEAEKDSIVFYLGMKEAVAENLGKDRIETIIKEEMGHIRVLSKELIAQAS